MRRLAPEKSDGFGGADGDTHDRSSGAIDPARQVHGDNRGTIGVDCLNDLVRLASPRSIEAGAKQRIDDESGCADRLRVERQYRIFPTLRSGCRVTLQAIAI